MKKVVIVGGGFAGMNAYLEFHRRFHKKPGEVEITMISERDTFLFTPLIHEVATGTLSPDNVVQSIRQVAQCCLTRFIEGAVTEVDVDKQTITYKKGKKPLHISYDYVILAAGSDTNYWGVPGAKEYALTLKNIDDVKILKNRIVDNFVEAQDLSLEEQKSMLRFVVVGGGATGVEIVGEMADLFNGAMRKAFPGLQQHVEIVIAEGTDRLVCNMEDWFSKQVEKVLKEKGNVRTVLKEQASKVTAEGVQFSKEFLKAKTVIWVAGVKARDLPIKAKKRLAMEERRGRIKVNVYLQCPVYKNVFVAGDQAWILDKEQQQPYPMRAQFAVREGKKAAENISYLMEEKPMKEFFWEDKGFIVSIGKGDALAKTMGIKLSGPLAWVFYRIAYLFNLVGLRAKLRTAAEWTINLFVPRDISKL